MNFHKLRHLNNGDFDIAIVKVISFLKSLISKYENTFISCADKPEKNECVVTISTENNIEEFCIDIENKLEASKILVPNELGDIEIDVRPIGDVCCVTIKHS